MYIGLITTSDDYNILETITKECVLSKKISPCAHILNNVNSFYMFENNFIIEKEYILIIKCKNKNSELIKDIIEKVHNYDIPEIISFKFEILSKKYKKWFNEK